MTATMQPLTVTEARKHPRFRMRQEIQATFSGAPVIVTNLSAEGMALRHEALIKVNSAGLIRIESQENTGGVTFRGRIRWSHISKTRSATGGLLYESGVRIEEVTDSVGGLLGRLIRAFGEKDVESLRLKQEAVAQRAKDRSTLLSAPAAPAAPRTITRDQILLIREAHTKLESSPDSAQQWYERARQSLARRAEATGQTAGPNRRDVLTVWEYLGGTIDLDVITAVLEAQST